MGWIGSVLLVIGLLAVGRRQRWGFIVGGVGETFWVYQSAVTGQIDLLVICIIFVLVYVHNWHAWGKPPTIKVFDP